MDWQKVRKISPSAAWPSRNFSMWLKALVILLLTVGSSLKRCSVRHRITACAKYCFGLRSRIVLLSTGGTVTRVFISYVPISARQLHASIIICNKLSLNKQKQASYYYTSIHLYSGCNKKLVHLSPTAKLDLKWLQLTMYCQNYVYKVHASFNLTWLNVSASKPNINTNIKTFNILDRQLNVSVFYNETNKPTKKHTHQLYIISKDAKNIKKCV